jgi:hypothetical protein
VVPSTIEARLAKLRRVRFFLERLWLAATAHPKWEARWAERLADEASVRREANKALVGVMKLWGSPTYLARLAHATAARYTKQGGLGDEREQAKSPLEAAMRAHLESRVTPEQLDTLFTDTTGTLITAAEHSVNAERAFLHLPPITPFEDRIAKAEAETVTYITQADLWRAEYAELAGQVAGSLAGAAGMLSDDVAHMLTEAANPAHPMSIPETVKKLRESSPGLTAKRAQTIARTETARVYGKTSLDTMKANGIKERRWITAAGSPAVRFSPVCDLCSALGSKAWVSVDKPIEADVMVGKRDPVKTSIKGDFPPYHPNCRCDIVANTDGWLPTGNAYDSVADRIMDRARAHEPDIARKLRELETRRARLIHLERNLKGRDSLIRKLDDFVTGLEEQGKWTFDTVEGRIHDSVRYTFRIRASEYVSKVEDIAAQMRARGFRLYQPGRNGWGTNEYKGINSVWEDPATGQRFEVQFHTTESQAAKDKSWILYEEQRVLPKGSPEWNRLQEQITAIWDGVPVPSGAEGLAL